MNYCSFKDKFKSDHDNKNDSNTLNNDQETGFVAE